MAAESFSQGLVAFQERCYAEALAVFTKAIQLHPRHARAYTNRGLSYARLGDYQQAYADLSQALALDPQQVQAYYVRGLLAMLLLNVPQVQQNLQRAADLDETRTLPVHHALRLTSPPRP